jgi:hypothetical protein
MREIALNQPVHESYAYNKYRPCANCVNYFLKCSFIRWNAGGWNEILHICLYFLPTFVKIEFIGKILLYKNLDLPKIRSVKSLALFP